MVTLQVKHMALGIANTPIVVIRKHGKSITELHFESWARRPGHDGPYHWLAGGCPTHRCHGCRYFESDKVPPRAVGSWML